MKISVCVATKNRPEKIKECLKSITNTQPKPDEIVVVDQSGYKEFDKILEKINHVPVLYFHQQATGKSKGLNLAINKAQNEIIAFTDDDCLVEKDWLKTIKTAFAEHPEVVGVFGQIKPFNPSVNQGLFCPCTFNQSEQKTIITPSRHWEDIGFGNNMAYRRSIFDTLGGFKEWLGPGSIGSNAEDAEFSLRVLTNKRKLFYSPKMIVYHNRWLSKNERQHQELSYSCGEMACYGYFALKGHDFAKSVVKDGLRNNHRQDCIFSLKVFAYQLRGCVVGLFFWFVEKFMKSQTASTTSK